MLTYIQLDSKKIVLNLELKFSDPIYICLMKNENIFMVSNLPED